MNLFLLYYYGTQFYDNETLKVQAEQDHNAAALKRYQDEQRVQTAALTGRCVTSSTQKDKRHRRFSDVGQDVNAHKSKDSDSFIASFAKLAIKEEKDLELLKKQRQHYIDAARATESRVKQLEQETKELRQELLDLKCELMNQRRTLHVLRDTVHWVITCTQELFNKILNINLQLPPLSY